MIITFQNLLLIKLLYREKIPFLTLLHGSEENEIMLSSLLIKAFSKGRYARIVRERY